MNEFAIYLHRYTHRWTWMIISLLGMCCDFSKRHRPTHRIDKSSVVWPAGWGNSIHRLQIWPWSGFPNINDVNGMQMLRACPLCVCIVWPCPFHLLINSILFCILTTGQSHPCNANLYSGDMPTGRCYVYPYSNLLLGGESFSGKW